jgi:uncharacterized protein
VAPDGAPPRGGRAKIAVSPWPVGPVRMDTLLDLSRFRGNVSRLERRYEPAQFDRTGDEFRVAAPIELEADIRREGRKFHLVGRVATRLELDCSRCLEPFAVSINAPFDVVYMPEGADAGEPERQVQPEEVSVEFYKDDVIDLGQLMGEQFYLALPMKPLCRDDCKGLCPDCGINRNRETCTCKREWVDPRLAPLKALFGPRAAEKPDE